MWLLRKLAELVKKFAGIDQTASWRSFAIVAAALGAIYLLYDHYFVDTKAKVVFEVIANTSVVDIKEDVPALSVLFNGADIRQQKKTLSVISLKVINDSSVDILKDRYDSNDPIGFRVTAGQIVTADVSNTSNEYLKRNVRVSHDPSAVVLPEVILEAAQYYVVKLLVLSPVDSTVAISAMGHVGGVREIVIREPYRDAKKVPFWSEAFSGRGPVQAVRVISYSVILIVGDFCSGSCRGSHSVH